MYMMSLCYKRLFENGSISCLWSVLWSVTRFYSLLSTIDYCESLWYVKSDFNSLLLTALLLYSLMSWLVHDDVWEFEKGTKICTVRTKEVIKPFTAPLLRYDACFCLILLYSTVFANLFRTDVKPDVTDTGNRMTIKNELKCPGKSTLLESLPIGLVSLIVLISGNIVCYF